MESRPTSTLLSAETVRPTARPALGLPPLTALSVCQASSPSPPLTSASIPARLHTSPTQPLTPATSAILPAPRVSPQPPTAKPAKLNITPLQALFQGPVLSAMEPVTSARGQATQPVKPARLATTQLTDILRPVWIPALPLLRTTSSTQESASSARLSVPLAQGLSTRTVFRARPLTSK